LFSALSDQIWADTTHHEELRAACVKFQRDHPDEYKPFVTVRASERPKRKMANDVNRGPPTAAEMDARLEYHLTEMAKGGTWGGHMEISAFSRAYNVKIKIFHPRSENDFTHTPAEDPAMCADLPTVMIAYNPYGEHYSSVRLASGTHRGIGLQHLRSSEPRPTSPNSTIEALAVSFESDSSRSPSSKASSVERDLDGDEDDEDLVAPAKRARLARVARLARAAAKVEEEEKPADASASQESLTSAATSAELPDSGATSATELDSDPSVPRHRGRAANRGSSVPAESSSREQSVAVRRRLKKQRELTLDFSKPLRSPLVVRAKGRRPNSPATPMTV
jgi:OTU-like cysteine protease